LLNQIPFFVFSLNSLTYYLHQIKQKHDLLAITITKAPDVLI